MLITITDFDEQFSHNYEYFQNYVKVVSGNNYNKFEHFVSDLVNDVYCEIKDRVIASAVTATTVISYVKQSLRNALYHKVRPDLLKNRIKQIDYQDVAYEETIEITLSEIEEDYVASIEYHNNSMYLSKKIFQYLEQRYDEQQMFIMKTYFLMKKRMTYKRLSKATDISITQCSLTIKEIKKDIKDNFEVWLRINP